MYLIDKILVLNQSIKKATCDIVANIHLILSNIVSDISAFDWSIGASHHAYNILTFLTFLFLFFFEGKVRRYLLYCLLIY
jgi:hypothetical protein